MSILDSFESARAPRSVPSSRRSSAPLQPVPPGRLLGSDVAFVAGIGAALVLAIWWRHGALAEISEGWNGSWAAVSQLTGLVASLTGLAGLVLVARPRVIEREIGLDRMFDWHRLLGGTMAVVLVVHVVTAVLEWRPTAGGWWPAILDFTGRESYFGLASIGAALVGVVAVSSMRSLRRQLSYEAWYAVHLLAYVGLAVSFGHTIVWGNEFADDRLARTVWIGLHAAVIGLIVAGRWRHLVLAALRQRLTLSAVTRLSDDTMALTLSGRALARMRGDAGQFVFVRPLVRGLWWQSHPFSLSAAPTTAGLELTVKARGDASRRLTALPVGTRFVVEGPYGATTSETLPARPTVFVVGGVGIAPVRALLQRLGPEHRPVVLVRAHRAGDLVHFAEVEQLAVARGGRALALVGPTARLAVRDPFAAPHLLAAVPDIAERVAVLCGPERLLSAARAGLRAAGIDRADIHYERCWW